MGRFLCGRPINLLPQRLRDTSQQKATLLFHYYAKRIQFKSPTHTHTRTLVSFADASHITYWGQAQ